MTMGIITLQGSRQEGESWQACHGILNSEYYHSLFRSDSEYSNSSSFSTNILISFYQVLNLENRSRTNGENKMNLENSIMGPIPKCTTL